ncbi:MAG: alpha/beta hydrolase [Gammaproteobacteria bacterium]
MNHPPSTDDARANASAQRRVRAVALFAVIVVAGLIHLLGPLLLYPQPRDRTLEDGTLLRWVPCDFATPFWRPVHCGRLRLAESPPWELAVLYVPDVGWSGADDPVLYLNGGPGASAYIDADGIDYWLQWIDDLDTGRDWYIYEQRGTGQGEPSLTCEGLFPAYREQMAGNGPRAQLLARVQAVARNCFTRLQAEGWALDALDTPLNAADALALMEAVGRDEWNLFGSSYGTRLALELMRTAPRRLRAVVLDGVYPPRVNMRLSAAWLMQHALDRVAGWCARDPLCSVENADFASQYPRVFEQLKARPLAVRVDEPGGEPLTVRVDDSVLADVVFSALYWWRSARQVPNLFNELHQGRDPVLLREMTAEYVAYVLDESISDPVMVAVDCHDAGAVSREDYFASVDRFPLFSEAYREAWPHDTCHVMPGDGPGPGFREAVHSALPTLLLSGELDPVTPPVWAREAAHTLPNSFRLTLPGVGHGAVENASCVVDVVRTFLDAPNADPSGPCLE